jgi:hypothetical protein
MQTGHTLVVRRAVATDHARLAALLSDMQAHYGSPDPRAAPSKWLAF